MRPVLMTLVFLGAATSSHAQEPTRPCHPVTTTRPVVVTATDGSRLRGTLLCLSEDEVVLTRDGEVTTRTLSLVQRVAVPSDPVWDGAAKGAALGAIVWALWCGECDAGFSTRQILGYTLMGVAFDALQTNRQTIYAGRPRGASVAWRIRF